MPFARNVRKPGVTTGEDGQPQRGERYLPPLRGFMRYRMVTHGSRRGLLSFVPSGLCNQTTACAVGDLPPP